MQSGHRPAVAGQGQHPRKREGERSRQTACNPGKIRSSTRPPASAKGAVPTDRTRVRSSSKPYRDGKREGGRFLQSVAERDRRSSPAAGIRGRQRVQSAAEEPTANGRHRRGGGNVGGPRTRQPKAHTALSKLSEKTEDDRPFRQAKCDPASPDDCPDEKTTARKRTVSRNRTPAGLRQGGKRTEKAFNRLLKQLCSEDC